MFRWDKVTTQTANGFTMKWYRDRFVPPTTVITNLKNRELDDVAYSELGKELFMYKIMDTNFIKLWDERFDRERIKTIGIPNE